jgi:AraC-like DNA-binding protein
MSYRELLPHPALRSVVDRYWVRAAGAERAPAGGRPATAAVAARILPDGCIDILVDVASGEARVVGAMTRAVLYAGGASASIAAVRFKPGCAAAFLRVPAHELTDRVVTAAELGLRWLTAPPSEPGEPSGALAALERLLLDRLGVLSLELGGRHAARRLFAARAPNIEQLASELGRSRQQLARIFRRELGVSPKELGRIARLQRAVDRLQGQPALALAAAAIELGYYDQAHMARDFRELAGITPSQARRSAGSIFPIRSLWLEP